MWFVPQMTLPVAEPLMTPGAVKRCVGFCKILLYLSVLVTLKVSQLLSSKKYVALKVLKDSLEYRQFSQLCILNGISVPCMCVLVVDSSLTQ